MSLSMTELLLIFFRHVFVAFTLASSLPSPVITFLFVVNRDHWATFKGSMLLHDTVSTYRSNPFSTSSGNMVPKKTNLADLPCRSNGFPTHRGDMAPSKTKPCRSAVELHLRFLSLVYGVLPFFSSIYAQRIDNSAKAQIIELTRVALEQASRSVEQTDIHTE